MPQLEERSSTLKLARVQLQEQVSKLLRFLLRQSLDVSARELGTQEINSSAPDCSRKMCVLNIKISSSKHIVHFLPHSTHAV